MPVPAGYTLEPSALPNGYTPDVAFAAQKSKARTQAGVAGALEELRKQPGFLQRAGEFFGLPTSLNQVPEWGMDKLARFSIPFYSQIQDAKHAQGMAQNTHSLTEFGNQMVPQAANLGTDVGSFIDNPTLKGGGAIAGTVLPFAALTAAMGMAPKGGGGLKTSPTGAPIYADALESGAIRSGIQGIAHDLLPGAANRLIQPFLRAGGFPKLLGYADPPAPRVGFSGTDFPMEAGNSMRGISPPADHAPSVSPPLRNPADVQTPLQAPPLSLATAPPTEAPLGGKPANALPPIQPSANPHQQPFNTLPESIQKLHDGSVATGEPAGSIPPKFKNHGIRKPKAGEPPYSGAEPKGLETNEPPPAKFMQDFVHELDAQPGQALAFNPKTGQLTFVDSITPDGKFAWVVDRGPTGIFKQRSLPIRKPASSIGKLDLSKLVPEEE